MPSDEGELTSKSKLRVLDPVKASLTKSGLKLARREADEPDKKEFLYFPSVTYTRRQPPATRVNLFAYGTHDIIKLLVSGGVPSWVFQPQYWNKLEHQGLSREDERFYKYRSPTRRMCELWELKRRPNLLWYEIEKSIVEARQKQKKILRNVSKKADEVTQRTEKVLQKNAEIRIKGADVYLEKLEKRAKQRIPKHVQDKIDERVLKRLKKKTKGLQEEKSTKELHVTFPPIYMK